MSAPLLSPQSRFRLGRMVFADGVRGSHVWSFLIVALFSTCLMATINFLQPLLLTEYLHIPPSQQGAVSGTLVFWNEIVILALVGLFGAWSDKVGRPRIYSFGFLVMALGYLFFTRVNTVGGLTGVRALFAVGAAAVNAMLATVMADYPSEQSRGKFTGLIGVATGVGIMLIVFVFSKLPVWLAGVTADSAAAGRMSFTVIAGICVVLAVLAGFGLKKRGRQAHDKTPLLQLLQTGLKAGRDQRIRLAYAAAFVSRGDLAIVGTFLSLWIVQHAVAQGLTTADGLKKAGMIFGISQGAALLWAPIIGILCDRFNRVKMMALALFLAAAGYMSLGLIRDPTGLPMILASVLVGIGEISAVIASQALIGALAPAATRGSVVGVFGIFGAFGILIATKGGGYLFDLVAPAAPFVAIGCVNMLIFGLAMWTAFAGKSVAKNVDPQLAAA